MFFFELGLFLLAMLTLGLGEFVSRGLALAVWLTCAVASLLGYVGARRSLAPMLGRADDTLREARQVELDAKWAATLLYTWRRMNALLLVGVVVVGGWYWVGRP